ncbi:josephin-1 isoform X3 [Pieris napi]|uniref:josephin-1 isoform X3 n=1 Tax=Pieris napi TaxID=78633 RepID=UPI001FBAE214|nr:josephin-1 isoform X3 [Pieris napi]
MVINEMTSKPQIYHEKQVKELCALHALNNLFQTRNTFSKSDLDTICRSLSPNVWFNPHRSMLGFGNYDINVIMAALQKQGCEAIWFDKRKRRHWITIRQIQGNFYNLDSKLDSPQLIGRGSDLISYLKEQLDCKEKELFVVVSQEVEEKQLWMHQYTINIVQEAHIKDSLTNCHSIDSINSENEYRNRDAEVLRLNEVRNCITENSF